MLRVKVGDRVGLSDGLVGNVVGIIRDMNGEPTLLYCEFDKTTMKYHFDGEIQHRDYVWETVPAMEVSPFMVVAVIEGKTDSECFDTNDKGIRVMKREYLFGQRQTSHIGKV